MLSRLTLTRPRFSHPLKTFTALALLVASCRIADQTSSNNDLTELRITPNAVALGSNQSVQLRAMGRTRDGGTREVQASWSASGGTIDQTGRYTADQTAGDFDVVATVESQQLTASAKVHVRGSLKQVVLMPASTSVAPGAQITFTDYGLVANGDTVTVSPTFTATGGTITSDGKYTAGSTPGNYRVIATAVVNNSGTTVADTSQVTISGSTVPVATVTVAPNPASVAVGATVQLTATLKDANQNTLTGRTVTWTTSNASVATVNSGTGLVSGVAVGSATITATSEGKSGTSAITVVAGTPAPVATVTVTPNPASVAVGATVQLTATLKDANGNTLTGRTVAWTTSNASFATVNASTGLVTGVAAGSATITATSEGKSGTSAVTVVAGTPAPVATVTVTPNPASVAVGATVQLTATLKDANGNTLTGRTVAWTTSNASFATVNSSSGLVTGVAAGSATITATSEGKSGTSAVTVTAPSGGGSNVLVGAGDISDCGNDNDEATAKLLDGISGTVYTTGDNVYSDGTSTEYQQCYDPTWGRHKARTKPSPGNHDYHTSGAAGYYGYFGSLAGPSGRGYYSYDLGDWHIISLNSEVSMSAGSAQETWLRTDLAASTKQCTLAYWHKPRFSSGTNHGSLSSAQPLWQALYDFHAEIVLNGHEHNYERFAPQTPTGTADATNGIREFVVGTGGESHYTGNSPIANSQVFNGSTFGVLKLTLSAGTYSWQFIPVSGQSFTDSGSGTCH
jgi:uncharacterized protein YjdB